MNLSKTNINNMNNRRSKIRGRTAQFSLIENKTLDGSNFSKLCAFHELDFSSKGLIVKAFIFCLLHYNVFVYKLLI